VEFRVNPVLRKNEGDDRVMNRFLKITTILSALVFTAQGCVISLREDEGFHNPHRDGEHGEYWAHDPSSLPHFPQTAKQSVDAP
jgi:hypothetical protein